MFNASILSGQLSYRSAIFEDCDMLFAWANDPQTRKNAYNKEPIQYKNHVEWFDRKLKSADSWIFIALFNDSPVAVLRLDKEKNDLLITYSVAEKSRKRGIGKALIGMIPQIISDKHIPCDKVIAEVFKTNVASNKIFTNAGYQKKEKDGFSVYIYSNDIQKIDGK